jgi:DNA polymerase I-like protein with 3'-5' exonuclease and polymerase domains
MEGDLMKFTVLPMFHPAAALHSPRLWATLLEDWEFRAAQVPHDYQVIGEREFDPAKVEVCALDTETDGTGGLGQWSVAFREGGKIKVATFFGPRPGMRFPNTVVMHNAKYDLRELAKNKMIPPENVQDTMILAYCMGLGRQAPADNGKAKSGANMTGGLGLKYLCRRHLGMDMMTWKQVHLTPEKIPEYNAMDSVGTLLLYEKWIGDAPSHYHEIDTPLLKVLMAMEDRGIQIDPDYLKEFAEELDQSLAKYDLPLNPFAPQEVTSYIYGTLGLEPWKFTESGAPSTDEDVLEAIHDPICDQILEYKRLYKEKETYVENYTKAMDFHNRIHPEFKQTSTSTGRLSCARPNLQNVFKRDDRVRVRALFCAKPGYSIVRGDFDQLDFRALAAITQDPTLIGALNSGKKIHTVTQELMGLSYEVAKIANFSAMFKAEAWKLSQEMGCTIDEAKAFQKQYFEKFPRIKQYQVETEEKIRAEKKVTIPFEGRTRRLDAMYVDQWRIQQEGIREGISTPVQGLEAFVVKKVMIGLHYKWAAPMVSQIHDEILCEVPDRDAQDFAHWLKSYVPTVFEANGVRFPMAVGVGKNWYTSGLKENEIK